ncbi:unnamed protein product [Arctia plantaginis]|uniref:Uncharacterized protein n=1 Tax=Arctia plantaginis TaxID=874455 RepID=A0A8S1BF91_ARCPL|nr:unnamed protein product [Arctia plantaginis]
MPIFLIWLLKIQILSGYKTLCMKNDSLSSDNGYNQNSPKYPQSSVSYISSDDNRSSVEKNMVQSEMNKVLYRKEHSGEYLPENMEGCKEHFKVGSEPLKSEPETNFVNIAKINLKLKPIFEDLNRYLIEDMTNTTYSPKTSYNFEDLKKRSFRSDF